MSVGTSLGFVGVTIMVLGYLAMAAAPKGSGSGDPDDDAVQPWTAWLFAAGVMLTLAAVGAVGLHQEFGWPESVAFTRICWVLCGLGIWVVLIWRITRWKKGTNR